MTTTLRDNIIDVIRTISDSAAQIKCEADVPIANVPAELVCWWFDDFYHPESELHRSSFSKLEREVLADFHEFYDARVDKLPLNDGVETLLKTSEWQEIQSCAKSVLDDLGWAS